MKKFDVEITETLQRTVSVEADSRAEAERLVTEAWNNEDYVLDSTDFVGVDSSPTVWKSYIHFCIQPLQWLSAMDCCA